MGAGGKGQVPAALLFGKRPDGHCRECWVDQAVGLEGCEKISINDFIFITKTQNMGIVCVIGGLRAHGYNVPTEKFSLRSNWFSNA
jgi:hypothetical protein